MIALFAHLHWGDEARPRPGRNSSSPVTLSPSGFSLPPRRPGNPRRESQIRLNRNGWTPDAYENPAHGRFSCCSLS
jgi:hypothetical protein